jgi:hypothetical protein
MHIIYGDSNTFTLRPQRGFFDGAGCGVAIAKHEVV